MSFLRWDLYSSSLHKSVFLCIINTIKMQREKRYEEESQKRRYHCQNNFCVYCSDTCCVDRFWNKSHHEIRAGAGTDNDILGSVPEGDTATLLEERDDGWGYIQYGDLTGYVYLEYFLILDPAE